VRIYLADWGPIEAGDGEGCVMTELSTMETRTRVLLVEDEAMICEMAAEVLADQGFKVQAVSTAMDALRYLMSGSEIDVLFTDVNLPGGMDGEALAQRARELRPDLPVMYTSGRRSVITSLDPVEGSMFIPKPYNPFEIGALLEYLVAAKKIGQRNGRGAATPVLVT
jgi:DNA-binding response OmpR family regulator